MRAHPIRATIRRASAALAAAAIAAATLAGCAATESTPDANAPALPPAGGALDYQLGGAYDPPAGVQIVARDRAASPADGLYNICYVNAFQTQPGELDRWPDALLLHEDKDTLVHDPDWPDEVILDTRQSASIADVVVPWIRGCADDGFDAVEFDNLDTYTRTGGALTRDDNLALATLLVTAAHDAGLAAGQKNAAEDAPLLHSRAGFDFAVTEECVAYDECDAYTSVYGEHVLAIEYPDTLTVPFAQACAAPGRPASLVLRDRDLVTPGEAGYAYERCG